jgi:hypothetical protein
MALFARCVLVYQQPGIDYRRPLVDCRARPRRIHLPRRRDRVLRGLAHRPTVHAMTIRQLTDRQVIQTAVSPDFSNSSTRDRILTDLSDDRQGRRATGMI